MSPQSSQWSQKMFRNDLHSASEREISGVSVALSFISDDLMEKLKLLNYEKQLLREMKMKQLHRFYFMRPFNSGEQFFMFISICAWLIRLTGRHFEQPQEYDDPNLVISKIIKSLQDMDIPLDSPTSKLIQGAGATCIYMLDSLATQAMKATKLIIRAPDIKKEDTAAIDAMENDSEVILEKVEELNALASDESDDEGALSNFGMLMNRAEKSKPKEYKIETVADSESWRMELEHVLPKLKFIVKADPRDWRAHLEQMKSLRRNIQNASEETQGQLKKLKADISLALDKIESREKHLNSDLKKIIQVYKQISLELQELNVLSKENDRDKMDIEQKLFKVSNELDNTKIQMEQRGNTMTDGSSLINIKKAILKIKEDIMEMDIKIGIMQHALNTEIMKQCIRYAELESMSLME